MKTETIRLDVQRRGEDGWFFVKSPDAPGLFLFGPEIDELLEELPHAFVSMREAQSEFAIDRARTLVHESLRPVTGTDWLSGRVEFPVPAPAIKTAMQAA